MPLSTRPAWLTRQENGTIGEARTRAFVLDRFWILERSVDIEGADLIIQRRFTEHSLLDPTPPRLGFVQAKFYQNTSTTQYVHKEYIYAPNGSVREDFFLMAHTGAEAQCKAYFLTAKDIVDGFTVVEAGKTNEGRFALPGTLVLTMRYAATEVRRVLDYMEASLVKADFLMNRRFMAWALPPLHGERGGIDPEFLEDIHNHYGDIPKAFSTLKKRAENGYWDLQEAASELRKIMEATDPEKALEVAERLHNEYASGSQVSVRLPDNLADEDFLQATRHHKERHGLLKRAGLLDAHATLKRVMLERLTADVAPRMPLSREEAYTMVLTYDPLTLKWHNCSTSFVPFGKLDATAQCGKEDQREGILSSDSGQVSAFLRPGCYAWNDWFLSRAGGDQRSWEEKIRSGGSSFVAMIVDVVLKMRFPELRDEG